MSEILYLLRAIVFVFVIILIYGVVSLIMVPLDYGFAEPFVDVGIFLYFPFSLLFPNASDFLMGIINHLETSISGENGFFLVFAMVIVVAFYSMVLGWIYSLLKKRDKKRYKYEI